MTFQPEFHKINSGDRIQLPKYSEIVTFKMSDTLEKGIGNIIAKTCNICVTSFEAQEKAVAYEGGILCTVAFIDLEGAQRTMTYKGVISGKISAEFVKPTSFISLKSEILDCSVEDVKGSVASMAVAYQIGGACVNESVTDVLVGGEGIFVETDDGDFTNKTLSKSAQFQLESTESIKQNVSLVLSCYGSVIVENVNIGEKIAVVDGVLKTYVTYMTAEDDSRINTEVFDIPFHEEFELEQAKIGMTGTANVSCCDVGVTAYSDENKKMTRFEIAAHCVSSICAFAADECEFATEVFSCENELLVTRNSLNTFVYKGRSSYPLDEKLVFTLDEEYERVESVISASVEMIDSFCKDEKIFANGILKASVLMYGEEGYKLNDFEMPISYEMQYDDCGGVEVDACMTPMNVTARLKLSNELELFGKINVNLDIFEKNTFAVITELELGEEKPQAYSAIVVYVGEVGDSVMDVARKLNVMPKIIEAQNKELTFPLNKGDKVVIYRQKKVN
ncbi:MAG: DUF3794 domain-containing protein [Clostridia bacterium]